MLSAVLKSEMAVKVSIQIMNAFVAMRRFLLSHTQIFQRLDNIELKQIETDQKLDRVLNAIEQKTVIPKQGIFYNGQVFDAWNFVSNHIRSAKKSIIPISFSKTDNNLYTSYLLNLLFYLCFSVLNKHLSSIPLYIIFLNVLLH